VIIPIDLLLKDPEIIKGLLDGSLKRFGSVIRDAKTGRIVRHLVESPDLTQKLIELTASPIIGSLDLATNVVGHGVTWKKLNKVQQQLSVVQQQLSAVMGLSQIAAGASVLNLGVSVAGFAYMAYKMHQLQKSMDTMQQTMEAGFGRVEGKLDQISGQLSYLQLLVEDSRQQQAQLADAINELHQAFLVKEVANLQAAIQNRQLFPDSPINEDLKTAASARNFLSNQALKTSPEMDARKIMIADIAIQGWAVATSTEAYILLETGHILEAKQILNSEVLRFKQLAGQWTEVLLNSERSEMATAYRFMGDRFKGLIADERVERIAMLSPMDTALTEDQKRRKLDDIEVEFEMSYNLEFDESWIHRQVAEAEYLDKLSELSARIEGLEAFAQLCEETGVKSSRELLPDKSAEPGLYLLNPSKEA